MNKNMLQDIAMAIFLLVFGYVFIVLMMLL